MINKISLVGTVLNLRPDHTTKSGQNIYRIELSCKRLSGTEDFININIWDNLLVGKCINVGDRVCIDGSIKTYTRGNHTIVIVQAKSISKTNIPEQDYNVSTVQGIVSKPVIFRQTPLNKRILEVILDTTTRNDDLSRIPCIMWGGLAYKFKSLQIGTVITVEGRLQSREYQKQVDENTTIKKLTTEFSITKCRLNYEADTNKD